MRLRFRAALCSLTITVIILLAAFLWLWLVWYPKPFFALEAVEWRWLIMAGVQLVLGPVLVFLLFRPGKRGLVLDLVVVGVMQVLALAAGMYVLHAERPQYLVFAVDRFEILDRRDVDRASLSDPRFQAGGQRGPLFVVASLPTEPEAAQRLLEETVFQGRPDIERRPEFWSLYSEDWAKVMAVARPLSELAEARPEAAARISKFSEQAAGTGQEAVFLPAYGRRGDHSLVFDRLSGTLLGSLAVDPWL